MSVARRSSLSYPRQWSPRMVPTWPVEVNWRHPLASGLVFLILPGACPGLSDLAGNAGSFSLQSAASYGQTIFGNGLSGAAPNQGASAATVPSALRLATSGTLHWAGSVVGTPSSSVSLVGVTYTTTDSDPYLCYALLVGSGSAFFWYNANGSRFFPAFSAFTSADTSCAVSFTMGGTISVYRNGIANFSTAMQSGTISYSASSTIDINTYNPAPARQSGANTAIAGIYNYALPSSLLAWLNAEPFAMLRPIIRRQFYYAGALIRRRPIIVGAY